MLAFLNRTKAMAIKEAIHIARDVQVIYMALGMPVVLLLLFGYAISFDLQQLPLGLVDQDHSPASRSLVQAIVASDAFEIAGEFESTEQVEAGFRSGDLKVALVIEKGFARRLKRNQAAYAQVLLDGADGNMAGIALGYVAGVGQAENLRLLAAQGQEMNLPISGQIRARFNPGMRSTRFIIPGLIAMILAIMAVLLTALTIAREWERGSMEQLFSTPVGRLEVVIGKLLPYLAIGLVQVLLVVTVGTLLFDVPFEGSVPFLFFTATLFLMCMLGQGLLISVITRSQMVSTQAGMLSAFLPTMILSGFMFPVENMPTFLQIIATVVPARYFIEILRGVMLKGNGFAELWPQVVALGLFALVMLVLSTLRFRRRLD